MAPTIQRPGGPAPPPGSGRPGADKGRGVLSRSRQQQEEQMRSELVIETAKVALTIQLQQYHLYSVYFQVFFNGL